MEEMRKGQLEVVITICDGDERKGEGCGRLSRLVAGSGE